MKSAFHIYSEKLEKILCKYMEHIEEGSHLDGYEMADLIREVSGNELDARFVELYLKYVETGRGGKILKWDIKSPYDEETKMKITREGSENNPRFKLMEKTSAVYGQIERMFGAQVAALLEEYCALKELDPYKVAFDETADGTGSTLWDKFAVWAKNKKHVNVNAKFDDYDVDAELNKTSGRGRATRTYDTPADADIYGESSGMSSQDVADFLCEELQECEWVDSVN